MIKYSLTETLALLLTLVFYYFCISVMKHLDLSGFTNVSKLTSLKKLRYPVIYILQYEIAYTIMMEDFIHATYPSSSM